MIVNMKKMLLKAKENKYAVPQFNINNLEWAKFILEECNENNSPVILGISESTINYMGGYNTVSGLIYDLVHDLKINIPVCIHLDHGKSLEVCKKAIDANFTSVMFDGSNLSLEENIKITKQIKEYAGKRDVTIEAEIGKIGEIDGKIEYTNLDDCVHFINETNIDALAPSVGSFHGVYKERPVFNISVLEELTEKFNIPLVLHGGSGISDNQIRELILNGICKININTDLQVAWANSLKDFIKNNSDIYDPRKIIKSGENNMKNVIKQKLIVFNSCNKA